MLNYTRLERLVKDKHSSLFEKFVNEYYEFKILIGLAKPFFVFLLGLSLFCCDAHYSFFYILPVVKALLNPGNPY